MTIGLFISSAGRLLPAGEPENRCQPSDAPWLRLTPFVPKRSAPLAVCPALRCPSILRFCAAAPVFSFVKLRVPGTVDRSELPAARDRFIHVRRLRGERLRPSRRGGSGVKAMLRAHARRSRRIDRPVGGPQAVAVRNHRQIARHHAAAANVRRRHAMRQDAAASEASRRHAGDALA